MTTRNKMDPWIWILAVGFLLLLVLMGQINAQKPRQRPIFIRVAAFLPRLFTQPARQARERAALETAESKEAAGYVAAFGMLRDQLQTPAAKKEVAMLRPCVQALKKAMAAHMPLICFKRLESESCKRTATVRLLDPDP